MKTHINKEKIEKKGFFGGGKSWVVISAYYELNDEERNLLNSNKNLLDMFAFDLPFRGPSGDTSGESSPKVKQLTDERHTKKGIGHPIGAFFTNEEIQEAEEIINEGARTLKAELFEGSLDSSTSEKLKIVDDSISVSENKIKESIKKELSKLRIEHQQAINSFGWLKKCQNIGEKFNLTETEIHNFKVEVALLLLGLSDLDTLNKFLDDEIGGTGWEEIENLVIENILEPIGYVIEKINKNEITFPTFLYFDDLYKLDLPKLLAKSSLSGKRKSTVDESYFNYYDCVLDTTFLNAFDIIRIEFAWEEKEIKIDPQGRTLGLTLLSQNKTLHKNQIAFAVESIVQSCKVDGELDGAFSEYEAKEFIEGNKNFLLFDHPNGHDIGIHKNDEVGISVDLSITYEAFLKYREMNY